MAQAQLERWARAMNHPRTGRIWEYDTKYVMKRVVAVFAFAFGVSEINRRFFWQGKPQDLDPEFMAEAKRIGPVAQRVNGPPVFLNPFRNRIPGNITGPEDVKKMFE